MRRSKTSVHHWRYEDGADEDLSLSPGWCCWVYPEDDIEFESWMTRMCPTAEICHRFNSGNPMWTVQITDEKEATMFTLMWGN